MMKKIIKLFLSTKRLKICLVVVLVLSNLFTGYPFKNIFPNSKIPTTVDALTTTYSYASCASSNNCDTSTDWWASADDVDQFLFDYDSTNRNAHTEASDANYTALSASDDSRYSSANPGSGDEIIMWFEMKVNESPETISQINFTFEGSTSLSANYAILVKDDTNPFEYNSSWTRVGDLFSIAANTETSVTRTLAGTDFSRFIDSNGIITWVVYEDVSAAVVSTDYVKMDVITHTVEQEGYRWRNDDGSETSATWLANQDTNISHAKGSNVRLRTILNDTASGNEDSTQYQLEYKLSTDSKYRPVQSVAGSLSYSDAGTPSGNDASFTAIVAPATVNPGDLLVIGIANKYPTTGPLTPYGWTAITNNQASGGAGSAGVDTGNVYSTIFVREAEGWEDNAAFILETAGGNSIEAQILRFTKGTGKEWDLAATTGTDTSQNTTWSVTASSNPGITAGDIVLTTVASNSDGASWSGEGITATGITIGADTERNETASTGGDDVELIMSTHTVASGTASAVPQMTATVDANVAGAVVFLRLRQVDAPVQLSASSNIAASGESTTAQLSVPTGSPAFTAGRIQDDENPTDAVDINDSQYTEMEWSMIATNEATDGETYQFRVTANGQILTTYTVTPEWTIGSALSFTQNKYRWYVDNDSANPVDAWSSFTGVNLAENTPITVIPSQYDPPQVGSAGQELRLRINLVVSGTLNSDSKYFKLQYRTGSDSDCSTGSWTDVNTGNAWIYASSSVSDGDNITEILSDTTSGKGEEYVKSRPSSLNHVSAADNDVIEYDFHVIGNAATNLTRYLFRVVESDSAGTGTTVLSGYTNCAALTTKPGPGDLMRHGNVFGGGLESGFTWAD